MQGKWKQKASRPVDEYYTAIARAIIAETIELVARSPTKSPAWSCLIGIQDGFIHQSKPFANLLTALTHSKTPVQFTSCLCRETLIGALVSPRTLCGSLTLLKIFHE